MILEKYVISFHLNFTFGSIAFQLQEELILDDLYNSTFRIMDLMVSFPKMVMLGKTIYVYLMHYC